MSNSGAVALRDWISGLGISRLGEPFWLGGIYQRYIYVVIRKLDNSRVTVMN